MKWVVAALLRLFPAGFRREHGDGLLDTFEHQWRERRGWPQAARTIADVIRSALCERLAELRRNRATHGYTPRRGDNFIMLFLQDLRYALRTFLKNPGYSLTAAVTLALGIGANTTIYSVVNAVLLKRPPYPQADRLVHITESLPKLPGIRVSWPDFVDWRAQNQVFDDMAVFQNPSRIAYRGAAEVASCKLGIQLVLHPDGGEDDPGSNF